MFTWLVVCSFHNLLLQQLMKVIFLLLSSIVKIFLVFALQHTWQLMQILIILMDFLQDLNQSLNQGYLLQH